MARGRRRTSDAPKMVPAAKPLLPPPMAAVQRSKRALMAWIIDLILPYVGGRPRACRKMRRCPKKSYLELGTRVNTINRTMSSSSANNSGAAGVNIDTMSLDQLNQVKQQQESRLESLTAQYVSVVAMPMCDNAMPFCFFCSDYLFLPSIILLAPATRRIGTALVRPVVPGRHPRRGGGAGNNDTGACFMACWRLEIEHIAGGSGDQ